MRERTNRVSKGPSQATLRAIGQRFKGFRPASEVLTAVRAVPTCFVQCDHAMRVGGFPIERFSLVHGRSNEGKTLYNLGLISSFLELGHFAMLIDAERTTPITWVREIMGPLAQSPFFFAERPESYEKTIALNRNFLNAVADAKRKGEVPPETSAIVVVDSLRKLVPEGLMKEILRAAKEDDAEEEKQTRPGQRQQKIKAGRDRSAQLKAKMNAAWMDEAVPLLEHAGAGMVAVAREMQDPDADPFLRKFGLDYKVGGGGAIFYDASLVARVERESWVDNRRSLPKDHKREDRKVYGERHRVTIRKTKIAGKDDKVAVARFHSSNGQLVPPGLDRARDVLELAMRFGIVEEARGRKNKRVLRYEQHEGEGDALIWAGEDAAVVQLQDKPLLARMEARVRERFKDHKPAEHDEATGEVEE